MKRIISIVAIATAVFVLSGRLAARQALAQKICPPCAAVQSVQSGLDTLPPGALGDKQWALGPNGVHVPWKPLDDSSGRPLPGTGATVVQIDTGVTSHPLLAGSMVDVHAADDLYGPGHRNVDLLLGGLLRFPGHGTKAASVIVARPEKANISTGILGVAPGVRLIPVRGTEGVVLFGRQLGQLNADQHRIARALNEAAKHGKGLFNARVDVISMSLGGWPPTSDLCVAVENATKAGPEISRYSIPTMPSWLPGRIAV